MIVATREERPHAQPRGKATPASWTVLAYLAGDNDLEGSLLGDLREMERVGSRPGSVEILAQIDRAPGCDASSGNWSGTRRYYVTRSAGQDRIGSKLLADLPRDQHGRPARAQGLPDVRRETVPCARDDAHPLEPRLGLLRPAGDALGPRPAAGAACAAAPARLLPPDAGVAAGARPAPRHRVRRRLGRLPGQPRRSEERRVGKECRL